MPDEKQAEANWIRAGNLEVRLEVPAGPHKPGDRLELGLHFRNPGQTPLRIYLLTSEAFRHGQSEFSLKTAAAAKGPPLPQPPPRPHGVKVTEKDFHSIGLGEHRRFTQSLHLDPRQVTGPGTVLVTWTYRNKITRWEAGAQTLDGPTEALFEGGDIPHIWTGKVQAAASLEVASE